MQRTPFIGRARELEVLNRSLPEANGGVGRFIALSGDAGIGKTRLIARFADLSRLRGNRVMWSQMIEGPGYPPYFSWLLVLRSCISQTSSADLADDLGAGAADIASIVPELREQLAIDASRTRLDSNTARHQLYDSVTRFFLRTAARQPLVLLFDNLHDADKSSLGLLEYFCLQIAGSPILVVAAWRESALNRHHPLRPVNRRLSRIAGYEHLPLRGLSRTEVAELLQAQSGSCLPPAVVQAVFDQSDGNPLFVTEVAAMLAQHDTGSRFSGAGIRFRIPESLREVVVARLDELTGQASKLLGVAAVLGREFDLPVLAELAAVRREQAVKLLQQAESAGIVVSHGPNHYKFSHALFREVLYEEHSTVERVKLHRKAGEEIEHRYRNDIDAHLPALAFHFFEAAQAGQEESAIHYCRIAALAAVEKRAYSEAAALLDCALQVVDLMPHPEQKSRFELLMKTGEAHYQSGELNAANQILMKAAIIAYRHAWWERLANALYLFQLVCQQSGFRHVSSVPLHQAVLENLADDSIELRATVLASLAKAYRTAGTPEKAVPTYRRSISLARDSGNPQVLLDCLRKGNWIIGRSPETKREGLAIAREALQLGESLAQADAVLDALVDVVFQLLDLGEISEAQAQLARLRDLATQERQPHFDNVLVGFETSIAILQGRWADALRGAQAGLRYLPLQGVLGLEGRFGFQIFAVRKALGSLDQVQDIVERIIATSGDSPLWLPGQVLLHCELQQHKRARAALEQLGDPRKLPRDDMFEIALAFLADACMQLNDGRRCAILYELLAPYRGLNLTLPGTLTLGAASAYLAGLALALRRHKEARIHFDEALQLNAAMGALPNLALTQVDYARMLVATGSEPDRVKAMKLLQRAVTTAGELQLGPVLRCIDDIPESSGVHSLTEREIEVLGKLATGLSNSKIAECLNISHSTVATHVRHIFRKTGVANRTEAADFARRKNLCVDP